MRLFKLLIVLILTIICFTHPTFADVAGGNPVTDNGLFIQPVTLGDGFQVNSPDGTKNSTWKHDGTNAVFDVSSGDYSFLTGQLLAIAGTAALPAYSFASDPDTGIYNSPVANALYFSAGGVEIFRFTISKLRMLSTLTVLQFGPDASAVVLAWDAANVLAQRNGTNAQEARWHNTYDGTNNEFFAARWSGDILFLETAATGTGTQRAINYDAVNHTWRVTGNGQWFMDGAAFRPFNNNTENLGSDGARPSTVFQYQVNLKETTTPTAIPNSAQIYTKTDNELYFQDGAGVERTLLHGASAFQELTIMPFDDPTGTVGNWEFVSINSSQGTHFVFRVPDTFATLISASIIIIPDTTETIQWDVLVSVSQAGVAHNDDERSALNETLSVTLGLITELDVSSVLSGLTAGDYVGLDFQSDTANIRVLQFELIYD